VGSCISDADRIDRRRDGSLMPARAPRTCGKSGCLFDNVAGSRYCAAHADTDKQKLQSYRQVAAPLKKLYNSVRWKNVRATVLARDPICVECNRAASAECDHIERAIQIVKKYGVKQFFNPERLNGLCKSCHSSKTAKEVFVK
jgi:5-methylcytosine-specific restriction enzyme A